MAADQVKPEPEKTEAKPDASDSSATTTSQPETVEKVQEPRLPPPKLKLVII